MNVAFRRFKPAATHRSHHRAMASDKEELLTIFRAFDKKKNGLVSQPLLHRLLLKAGPSPSGSFAGGVVKHDNQLAVGTYVALSETPRSASGITPCKL